ncbi:Cation channel sperm-associated protein 1 (CatSper1), partial [Durusdinium trenchii]
MKRVSKTSMLETLDAVRQQLVTSYDGIAELCHQHKEWQRSVENMIRRFENDVSQPALKTLAEEEQPALEDGSAGIAGDSAENPDQPPPNAVGEERDAPIESRARDSRLTQDTQITLGTLQSSNQMSPDRSHRYKRAHLHRAGRMSAIHPLLQSRKTVQQCPAGPLRKLLSDMLAKSEDTPSEPLSQIDRARRWAASLVSSPRFDYIAGFVILLNLVTIGFEAELSLEGSEYESGFWFAGVERMFLSIYIAEAAFRLFALGLPLLYDRWFILDLVLICTGAVALLMIPLASEELAGFEKVLVARGLRLLRLLRVLRMVHQFKIIWRLVYGFLPAWETIFASALLIIISLFIFACIAVEAWFLSFSIRRTDVFTRDKQ